MSLLRFDRLIMPFTNYWIRCLQAVAHWQVWLFRRCCNEGREVVVGLNPIITRAVLRKNDFLRVDMSEVRALKSDAARLIHSRLHWINHGAQRVVRLETLCGYLYGDYMVSRSALANRKATVRKALRELQKIGWVVTEIRDETFLVERPRLPGRLRSNNELPHGQTVNVLRSNAECHYDECLVTC